MLDDSTPDLSDWHAADSPFWRASSCDRGIAACAAERAESTGAEDRCGVGSVSRTITRWGSGRPYRELKSAAPKRANRPARRGDRRRQRRRADDGQRAALDRRLSSDGRRSAVVYTHGRVASAARFEISLIDGDRQLDRTDAATRRRRRNPKSPWLPLPATSELIVSLGTAPYRLERCLCRSRSRAAARSDES